MGLTRFGWHGRLLAGAVLPALLMVTLVGTMFLGRYQADVERNFLERGQAIARQLGAAAEYALFAGSRDTLSMLADGIRQGDPAILAVSVLDRHGQTLAHAGKAPRRMLPLVAGLQVANDENITTIQAPIRQAVLPISGNTGEWDGAAPVRPAEITGYIVLEISRAELSARKREMLQVTLVIMFGGLLLAGWISSRIAADVLGKLEAASRELARQKEAAEALARTDVLTGLANRRAFDEAAQLEVQRALRYGVPLALVLVDLDHFKSINDNHGHHFGDAVLKNVALVLAAAVRNVDLVGRWGGEEFVILMPDTGLEEAMQAAERMRLAIAGAPTRLGGHAADYTASFGVAAFQTGTMDLDTLLARADAALYRAKHHGRNRVETG